MKKVLALFLTLLLLCTIVTTCLAVTVPPHSHIYEYARTYGIGKYDKPVNVSGCHNNYYPHAHTEQYYRIAYIEYKCSYPGCASTMTLQRENYYIKTVCAYSH